MRDRTRGASPLTAAPDTDDLIVQAPPSLMGILQRTFA
jgi:hypothetical protein